MTHGGRGRICRCALHHRRERHIADLDEVASWYASEPVAIARRIHCSAGSTLSWAKSKARQAITAVALRPKSRTDISPPHFDRRFQMDKKVEWFGTGRHAGRTATLLVNCTRHNTTRDGRTIVKCSFMHHLQYGSNIRNEIHFEFWTWMRLVDPRFFS